MRALVCSLMLLLPGLVQAREATLAASPAVVAPRRKLTITVVSSRPTPTGAKFRVSNGTLFSAEQVSATTWLLLIGTADPGLIGIDCEHQDVLFGRTGIICAAEDPARALQQLAVVVAGHHPEQDLVRQMQIALSRLVVAVVGDDLGLAQAQARVLEHLLSSIPPHLLRHDLLTSEAILLLTSVNEFLIRLMFWQQPPPDPCPVRILWIKFNHKPGSLTDDALEIRKAFATPIDIPEWVEGETSPDQSPAAYAYAEAKDNKITIQADFTGPAGKVVLIRALQTGGPPFAHVAERGVAFGADGRPAPRPVTFELTPVTDFGRVSRRPITWHWQKKCPEDVGFKDLFGVTRTNHQIYTVLRTPQAPWTQAIGAPDNPWTDAMDVAITKGQTEGSRTSLDVATKMTQFLNGRMSFEYDWAATGTSRYMRAPITRDPTRLRDHPGAHFRFSLTFVPSGAGRIRADQLIPRDVIMAPVLDLTSFITEANAGAPRTRTIICYDLSAVNTSLCNVLGVGLSSIVSAPFGYIKPAYIIGSSARTNNPFRLAGRFRPFIPTTEYTPPPAQRAIAGTTTLYPVSTKHIVDPDDQTTVKDGRTFYLVHAYNSVAGRVFDAQHSPTRPGAPVANMPDDEYHRGLLQETNRAQDLKKQTDMDPNRLKKVGVFTVR